MTVRDEIRVYAVKQVSSLLGRLVFEARRASRSRDPDAVHDLRVAIRRFAQALRVFRQFFPPEERRKIRRRLRRALRLAAAVRDRDIALEWLAGARAGARSPLRARLVEERARAERTLAEFLRQWNRRSFSSRWRARLNLSAE